MLLTSIQPKIKALKTYYAPHYANEYAKEREKMKEKEKEKKMTIFTK